MGEPAKLADRIIAAIIDSAVGWVFALVPTIGAIVGLLYLLFKDAAPYHFLKQEEWKNKSIGKKLMNLEVSSYDAEVVDLATSAKRNIPLSIGSIIAIIPLLGWVLGPLVALVFGLIELFLVLTDKDRRRIGDRWGNTIVVSSAKTLAE